MIKHILLITGSHLSSNPRLVKEATVLSEAHFVVSVIFLQHIHELEIFDKEIIQKLTRVKFYPINFGSKNTASKCLNWKRLLRKLWIQFNSKSELNENVLFPEFKKIVNKINADLYIGHTLQALPVVAWAAKNHGTKFAFDAEDYHRGETSDDRQNDFAEAIENKYLNAAEYISTASKFISNAYHKHFERQKIITLNNFFTYTNLEPRKESKNNQPVKIVWFSQTIGLNRGLEEFISKLVLLNPNQFELHLRGTSDEFIRLHLLHNVAGQWRHRIFFHEQCSPNELNLWLQRFDIGLALEVTTPINRNICITNKIFQYLNAGLAVVATPTAGQKWVTDQAQDACIMWDANSDLGELKNWSENREKLEYAKEAAQNASKQIFDWNEEKKKLIEVVKQIKVD